MPPKSTLAILGIFCNLKNSIMQSSFGIVKMLNTSCSSEFFGEDSNMKHLTITINKFPRAGMEKNAKDVTILYMLLGRNTKATETKNTPGKKISWLQNAHCLVLQHPKCQEDLFIGNVLTGANISAKRCSKSNNPLTALTD